MSDGGALLSTEPIRRGNVSYLIRHREEVPGRSVLSPRMRPYKVSPRAAAGSIR